MSFTQYLWDAFDDLVDAIGALVDHDVPEVQNTDSNPTPSLPSTEIPSTYLPDRECTGAPTRVEAQHSDAIRDLGSEDANPGERAIRKVFGLVSNNVTDLKDQTAELQQHKSSNELIEKDSSKFNTYRLRHDLSSQNHTLQQDIVGHLRWEDRASMTIKHLKEDTVARKSKARFVKKATIQAKAAMQRQIDNCKRQIEASEQDKVRVSNEDARANEAHASTLQEVRNELEAQKEAAERHSTQMQSKHAEDISAANTKIEELRARQTFTFSSQREIHDLREQLLQAEKGKAEDLSTKNEEITALQTSIENCDSEIRRLGIEAESERKARREVIRQKNDNEHAKVKAEREVERLKRENDSLVLEKEKEKSRAVEAEGRAKGLQAQLRATERRAENWEMLHQKAEEDARDRVLSAYAVPTAPIPEENQTTMTTTSEEQRLSALVEDLRKENSELQKQTDCLTTYLKEWRRIWKETIKNHTTWEQEVLRWYENDKKAAIKTERAKGRATISRDAREQEIRRKCEEKKQKALAVERDNCRVQWEAREGSMRDHYTMKMKSHTNDELQKLRRKSGMEHKKQMKVKKSATKRVFDKALSHAVEVERSLLQGQLQANFQAEISNYKTRLESEYANARIQSEANKHTNSTDQVLLNEEIQNRDKSIDSYKKTLKEAIDAKRELETALNLSKAETERLSQVVLSYESQSSLANQTKSQAQTNLMAGELSRALKLFTEITIMGLDEKHRILLNELVLANKVVTDIRTTIEDEGAVVNYDVFQEALDRVMASSDPFDALDSRERPALHAQLSETYKVVGGLSSILVGERGDGTKRDILERIYSGDVKGKGKQGPSAGSDAASGPSFGVNGGVAAAPAPQPSVNNPTTSEANNNVETDFSNTSPPNGAPNPSANPSSTTPNSNAAAPQGEPELIDSATANANLDTSDTFDFDSFNISDVDFDDPEWQNFKFPD